MYSITGSNNRPATTCMFKSPESKMMFLTDKQWFNRTFILFEKLPLMPLSLTSNPNGMNGRFSYAQGKDP